MLTVSRVKQLLSSFADLRLLVVGDLMLDRYLYGVAERISPEAPVPVVRVLRETCVPGGAANVAANVAALGARADVAGLAGDDADAAMLTGLLDRLNIDDGGVWRRKQLATIVKTRIMADRQQVVRVDRDGSLPLDDGETRVFCNRIRDRMQQADGVILEDYGKGTLTQDVVDTVLSATSSHPVPVGFDPRDNHALCLKGITLATPNWREALHAAGGHSDARPDEAPTAALLDRVADGLMEIWAPRLLIMTLGPQGIYLAPRDGSRQLIPTRAREVFDVSGAGDTVIAACLLALAAGASDVEAAEIGNHAAGVVVGKLGTAVCSPPELIASIAGRETDVL